MVTMLQKVEPVTEEDLMRRKFERLLDMDRSSPEFHRLFSEVDAWLAQEIRRTAADES